jgi:hypothetical protein
MTDEWRAYIRPGREFASHETVNHHDGQWTRGEAGTQAIENFFSVFKRGMRGVYQHCSDQHPARGNRGTGSALGVEDAERATLAIEASEGKRLTYRRTRNQAEEAGAA